MARLYKKYEDRRNEKIGTTEKCRHAEKNRQRRRDMPTERQTDRHRKRDRQTHRQRERDRKIVKKQYPNIIDKQSSFQARAEIKQSVK